MNERITALKQQALKECIDKSDSLGRDETLTLREFHDYVEHRFVELILGSLSEELYDVAKRSKKANQEWADGVDHAAMLAQRMLMDLPQWPEEE